MVAVTQQLDSSTFTVELRPHSKTSRGVAGGKGCDLQVCCQIYCTKERFLEKQNQTAHHFAQSHKFTPVMSEETRCDRGKWIAFLKPA
jgi:hypothetical protein